MLSRLHVGPAAYRRGDIIRCTVMFGDEKERGGKVQVPVVFTVNGSKIIPLGEQTHVDYSPDKPLYPCVFLSSISSVLAKVKITKITITSIFKMNVVESAGAYLKTLAFPIFVTSALHKKQSEQKIVSCFL